MRKVSQPARQPEAVSEALRQSVAASGRSLNQISRESGIPYASLWRFVAGQGASSSDIIDRLAALMELRLVHSHPKS
jgi:predicted transcriptional regulator